MRTALIEWARIFWNSESVSALSDISRRCDDSELQDQLDALDRTLYSTSKAAGEYDFTSLNTGLQQWRKKHQRRNQKQAASLPPLYKSSATHS